MFEEQALLVFCCIGFGFKVAYLWDSKSVPWTENLHPLLCPHRGEQIMSEIYFGVRHPFKSTTTVKEIGDWLLCHDM